MGLIRLLAIGFLLYLGYRFLCGLQQKSTLRKEARRSLETDDILAEDPVCGKLVPRGQAVKYESNGQKFYFCSKDCCTTFRKEQGE